MRFKLLARQYGAALQATPWLAASLAEWQGYNEGGLQNRSSILTFLQIRPQAQLIADSIVLQFIGKQGLYGLGIGYVDAHLLAAASLRPSTLLWTRDKKLRAASGRLGIACPLR